MRRKNPKVSARLRVSSTETSSRSQKISNDSKPTRSLNLLITEEQSSRLSVMMRSISSFHYGNPQKRIQQLSRQAPTDWSRYPLPVGRPRQPRLRPQLRTARTAQSFLLSTPIQPLRARLWIARLEHGVRRRLVDFLNR